MIQNDPKVPVLLFSCCILFDKFFLCVVVWLQKSLFSSVKSWHLSDDRQVFAKCSNIELKLAFFAVECLWFSLVDKRIGLWIAPKQAQWICAFFADITWRNGMEDWASEIWIVKTLTDPLVFNATNFDKKKRSTFTMYVLVSLRLPWYAETRISFRISCLLMWYGVEKLTAFS